ncbi:MAG: response regulator [Symploca sp. SIO2B6]|nr:response regulator [Symploca sp. SIO2B6]
MNIISIDNYRASQRIHPLSLLAQMNSRQVSGCLRVSDGSTSWLVYLSNGELIYATYSQQPFKRLERHFSQMSNDIPSLGDAVYAQIQKLFNTVPESDIDWLNPPDYQAIQWLTEQGYLTVPQATTLLEEIAQEVFEVFLQVREGVHELVDCSLLTSSSLLPVLELRPLVEACQKRLREHGTTRSMPTPTYPTSPQSPAEYSPSSSKFDERFGRQNTSTRFSSLPNSPSPLRPSSVTDRDIPLDAKNATQNGFSLGIDNAPAEDQRSILFGDNGSSTSPIPSSSQPMSTQASSQSLAPQNFNSIEPPSESTAQFGQPASQPLKNFSSSPSTQPPSQASGRPLPSTDPLRRSAPAPHPQSPTSSPSRQSQFLCPSLDSSNPALGFYREQNNKDDSQALKNTEIKRQARPSLGYTSNLGASSLTPSKPLGEKVYKVACIDDSPMILHMIEAFLEDKSFSVIKINDPVRALMELMRSKPDIILLDITMPNLDGYELCALLRSRPDFRDTPIIMVTGSKGLIDRAKARLVKASGYLTKPFNQTQLLKMVFKLLK